MPNAPQAAPPVQDWKNTDPHFETFGANDRVDFKLDNGQRCFNMPAATLLSFWQCGMAVDWRRTRPTSAPPPTLWAGTRREVESKRKPKAGPVGLSTCHYAGEILDYLTDHFSRYRVRLTINRAAGVYIFELLGRVEGTPSVQPRRFCLVSTLSAQHIKASLSIIELADATKELWELELEGLR